MASPTPSASVQQSSDEPGAALSQTLDAILQFTGATAGWVGLLGPDGRLDFPVRAGAFSEAWLTLQQGEASVWGFAVRDEPTLLNEPPALALLGDPPLENLLSTLLRRGTKRAGQLVVANKPGGFTSHDATAVQTAAHLLSRQLIRREEAVQPLFSWELLRKMLDQNQDGIVIVNHTGHLVFANAVWEHWTGYGNEELRDRPAPFPFWVSHADLAALGELQPTLPHTRYWVHGTVAHQTSAAGARAGVLPFRDRNHNVFWCQVETTNTKIGGQVLTIGFLRQLPAGYRASVDSGGRQRVAGPRVPLARSDTSTPSTTTDTPSFQAAGENSTSVLAAGGAASFRHTKGMVLLLWPGGTMDFWDDGWEQLTGLTQHDLAGVSGELFLDWLFPRQRDRDFVADLFHQPGPRGSEALLEVAGQTGNRLLACTFLPVRVSGLLQKQMACGDWTGEPVAHAGSRGKNAWLLWVCDPEATNSNESRGQRFLRQGKAAVESVCEPSESACPQR
jgi:PAS domain S-box-containing protein